VGIIHARLVTQRIIRRACRSVGIGPFRGAQGKPPGYPRVRRDAVGRVIDRQFRHPGRSRDWVDRAHVNLDAHEPGRDIAQIAVLGGQAVVGDCRAAPISARIFPRIVSIGTRLVGAPGLVDAVITPDDAAPAFRSESDEGKVPAVPGAVRYVATRRQGERVSVGRMKGARTEPAPSVCCRHWPGPLGSGQFMSTVRGGGSSRVPTSNFVRQLQGLRRLWGSQVARNNPESRPSR
jgi:putative NIF3 family GTP cyclohydrolase 1 type 2